MMFPEKSLEFRPIFCLPYVYRVYIYLTYYFIN